MKSYHLDQRWTTARQFTIMSSIWILLFGVGIAVECPANDPYSCNASSVTGGPKCDGFLDEGKLLLVQIVFRNGDRSPVQPYPTDPWKHPSSWPLGFGQLTPYGKRKMVCLGEWLRYTYHPFFCEPCYDWKIHGLRSSDTDRNRQSAELFMMGLFPPPGGVSQYAINSVPTNMYHIQTKPCSEDMVLRADKPCAAADFEEDRIRKKNPYFTQACQRHGSTRECLLKNAGYAPNMEFTRMAGMVYDTLQIEEAHQMCFPDWAKSIYPQPLCELAGLDMFAQVMGMNIRRLRGGVLATYLSSNMKNKVGLSGSISADWTSCYKKLYAFSTHARVVTNLLGAFGYKRTHVPSYTAAVVVELRRIDTVIPPDSPFFVKIFYKDGQRIEPIRIPGCDCLCPLSTFDKYMCDNGLDITPMEFRAECPAFKDEAGEEFS